MALSARKKLLVKPFLTLLDLALAIGMKKILQIFLRLLSGIV